MKYKYFVDDNRKFETTLLHCHFVCADISLEKDFAS